MGTLNLALLLAGIGLVMVILRQVVRGWLGGPDREDLLRRIGQDERRIEKEAGAEVPPCPLCGSPTTLHAYRHITLWRCSKYPACRGFARAGKPSRPQFAETWSRKRSGGS